MAEEWRQLVGGAIRARRHELGLGPMEFASRLHVSVKTVERYERGESDGALRQLDEIATVLQTTPEALTTYAGERAERGTPDVLGSLNGEGPTQLDRIEAMLVEILAYVRRETAAPEGTTAPEGGEVPSRPLRELAREPEDRAPSQPAHGRSPSRRRAQP